MNKDIFSKKMEVIEGMFSFPITNNTTKEVTGFYDVEPFPNYSNADSKLSIVEKGDSNQFSKKLKDFILSSFPETINTWNWLQSGQNANNDSTVKVISQ